MCAATVARPLCISCTAKKLAPSTSLAHPFAELSVMSVDTSFRVRLSQIPQWFVVAVGIGAISWSLYKLPFSELGAPFFLLALLSIDIGSRYGVTLPRGRGRIALNEGFAILCALLLGGEAATLFAFLVAMGVCLRSDEEGRRRIIKVALAVISTYLCVR